jgi:hypothetical protein
VPSDRILPAEMRALLHRRCTEALARLAGTGAERAAVVEAAREQVSDDEHDPVTALDRLRVLHERGALTDEEFAAAKASVLRG